MFSPLYVPIYVINLNFDVTPCVQTTSLYSSRVWRNTSYNLRHLSIKSRLKLVRRGVLTLGYNYAK